MNELPNRGSDYASYLQRAGEKIFCHDGVYWHLYQGFLMPAYLPHATPEIDRAQAREAIRIAGVPFARWNRGFHMKDESDWWYVVRYAPYSLQQCSRSTRSKVRRGLKKLVARPVSLTEMAAQGYGVCQAAVTRHEMTGYLPSPATFDERLLAAEECVGTVEYVGVFFDEKLVGFSENHIQDGGVFWENIWYHPDYMSLYSSYVLVHYMLEYYLSDRGFHYVSDGCRSIYHQTGVQDFLMDRFGFEKAYSQLEVVYSPRFFFMLSLVYPFFRLFEWHRLGNAGLLLKVRAILLQERIRRNAL
ncbi:GNAT family N-acetyltransferase [Halomonas organivorans]|uniref:BioF2-like acetyltransferase domain-containing protein n=1 Tax=Halomonas organivorans TaxID=257772 RepID=A0A7W5BVR7_9GAMM|nr:GNAT family N-acetyltransferase [Halomonas organivorans]MBB3140051.1 hypothetical protein [Halomonas organivorans]